MNKVKKEKNYARKYAKDFNILTKLYQCYATFCLFWPIATLFYNIKFYGKKTIQKGKPYVYAPNHISYCDPFFVAVAGSFELAYMAKKELYESNYLAKNISRLGAFAVNREKLEVSTIKTAKEAFKAGWGLCIFPQGGIRKNKKIETVNKGFVVLSKMAEVDILPIAIEGLEKYNWNPFKKVNVNVRVGVSISYKLDDEEIIENWRRQIAELTGYELCIEDVPVESVPVKKA